MSFESLLNCNTCSPSGVSNSGGGPRKLGHERSHQTQVSTACHETKADGIARGILAETGGQGK